MEQLLRVFLFPLNNFELTNIEIHFSLAGKILEQIKDMPDGAKVQFKIID